MIITGNPQDILAGSLPFYPKRQHLGRLKIKGLLIYQVAGKIKNAYNCIGTDQAIIYINLKFTI